MDFVNWYIKPWNFAKQQCILKFTVVDPSHIFIIFSILVTIVRFLDSPPPSSWTVLWYRSRPVLILL